MKIVLASESPLRKRAMDLIGLPYETRPSRIDEKAIRHDDPAELTRQLAEAKALAIASEHPNSVIVSGDAVAAQGSNIFEKPRDKNEAKDFLKQLSGSHFQFVTSVAVLNTLKNTGCSRRSRPPTSSSALCSTARFSNTSNTMC
jgi:MAF protein